MSLANSRKTSPPSFAPNGNIGFGHAAVQARSRAWGWLASSSQVWNHSEFHQSFTLIPLAAPATIPRIPNAGAFFKTVATGVSPRPISANLRRLSSATTER